MSAIDVGSKKHYFTFKESMAPVHRMSPGMSSPNYGRMYETPRVVMNRNLNSVPYDDSVTFKQSYSSAIEPMDYDEWGNEEQEMPVYEMNAMPKPSRSYVQVTRQSPQPATKKIKKQSLSKVKQRTPHGSSHTEKLLHQSILSTDSSKGLSFYVDTNQRKMFAPAPMNLDVNGKKVFPVWSVPQDKFVTRKKGLSLPRFFTVTIDKLQKWPKILVGTKAIFELYAILENVTQGAHPRSKNIILKCEGSGDRLNCTFYEIDRALPVIEKGHWQRCIVLLRNNGNCQCLAIRSAKPAELKNLDNRIMSSSKSKALLLKDMY